MAGRIAVVGLGPAGADLIVPAARAAFESAPRRFVRTLRHPAVEELVGAGLAVESFDSLYESASDLDEVYRRIADSLVESAQREGLVAYGVPGSPAVGERSVRLLTERARAAGVEVVVWPGLSFADLAWARVGVDALGPARIVDARALGRPDLDQPGPLLVGQCDSALILGDVKLALLERLEPETTVVILHHLGLPDERVEARPLVELDRFVPDHLTSVYIDLVAPGPGTEFARLLALAERLRGPGGCPWDAEQTHHTLTRYLLEESYEVVEALEALPVAAPAGAAPDDPAYAALGDELGDVLFQVIIHAVLADEAGAFDATDVIRGIHNKLVRRHPHVFGDADLATADAVVASWEQIKKAERGSDSLIGEIPPGLPALLFTHKLFRKSASIGLEPGDAGAGLDRADTAIRLLRADPDDADALGDLLAAAVVLARAMGTDAESAMRHWTTRFRARFERMEAEARARGVELSALAPDAVAAMWAEAEPANG